MARLISSLEGLGTACGGQRGHAQVFHARPYERADRVAAALEQLPNLLAG